MVSSSGAPRVLVVDDEALIGMLVADMLEELGCEVVGPALDLASGLSLAREAAIDWAILDLSLEGQPSFPIAEALKARGVPFVFASGYGAAMPGSGFETAPMLQKPFQMADLAAALAPVRAI
jgi:DNA-binding response OmpR family regulator